MTLESIFRHEHESNIVTSKQGSVWLGSNYKVPIARDCVLTLWPVSSEIKGIVMKMRLSWTLWHQEPPVKIVEV